MIIYIAHKKKYSGEVTSKKPLGLWVEVTSLYNNTSLLLALYGSIKYHTKKNHFMQKKYINIYT
jgi:hypothetical protein